MRSQHCKRCEKATKPDNERWMYPTDGSIAHYEVEYVGESRPIRMCLRMETVRTACGLRYETEVDSSG